MQAPKCPELYDEFANIIKKNLEKQNQQNKKLCVNAQDIAELVRTNGITKSEVAAADGSLNYRNMGEVER